MRRGARVLSRRIQPRLGLHARQHPDGKRALGPFNDFYFNSLRSVDMQLVRLLDELDALGLTENTIVMFTSDHGEMGGARPARKGSLRVSEAIHLPLIIAHPDVGGGKQCKSLTSHIDIVPTVLSLCGVSADQAGQFAGRSLPGKGFLDRPRRPGARGAARSADSVLFYSGLATNDSELVRLISEARAAGMDRRRPCAKPGYRPNLKRGSLRLRFRRPIQIHPLLLADRPPSPR